MHPSEFALTILLRSAFNDRDIKIMTIPDVRWLMFHSYSRKTLQCSAVQIISLYICNDFHQDYTHEPDNAHSARRRKQRNQGLLYDVASIISAAIA